MSPIIKSRHIPLSEFYSLLQLEYLCLYLRSKIYKEPYIQYNIDSCLGKRKKIESISLKCSLPNIFYCEKSLNKYTGKLMNDWGLPNFQYRDEGIKFKIHIWDCLNWFQKGTDVKFKVNDEVRVGVIVFNDFDNKFCQIKPNTPNEKLINVTYNNISRPLPEKFWENLY